MSNPIVVMEGFPKEVSEVIFQISAEVKYIKQEVVQLRSKVQEYEGLPVPGESRYADIAHRLGGMDRQTWERLVSAGKAPPRVKRGPYVTMYDNAELIRYFNEKENYRAPSE